MDTSPVGDQRMLAYHFGIVGFCWTGGSCRFMLLDELSIACRLTDEGQAGKSMMVSILKWMALILLAPLFSLLFLLNTVNAFQLLYVMALRVKNRTSRPLWITLVGTFDSGRKAILSQFIARLPAIPSFWASDQLVQPGNSTWFYFDRKGLRYYQVVVRNDEKEYRQLVIDPVPSRGNFYRHEDNHFSIDEWETLMPLPSDMLSAALQPDKSWLLWIFFLAGIGLFVIYCWLLDLWLHALH